MILNPTDRQNHIFNCEKELLNAFVQKDLLTLDKLIHESALFVLPNGLTITKSKVLENYRNGDMSMISIEPSDPQIKLEGDTAVISVHLEMTGRYNDQIIKSPFRYLRVWKLFQDQWQIIAVSGIRLPEVN